MRQKEIVLNIRPFDELQSDDLKSRSWNTPMREDAFLLSDEEKIDKIELHIREIMQTLGLDLTDDSLSGTPRRVAKMYVKEVFSGLNQRTVRLQNFLKINITTMRCS